MPSLLEIVASADNFPYPTPNNHSDTPILDRYVPLYLTAKNYTDGLAPVGVLRPEVVAALTPFLGNEHEIDGLAEEASHLVRVLGERGEICAVYFADHTVRDGMMPTVMDNIISTWKEKGLFPRQLGGKTTEQCALYTPSTSSAIKNFGSRKPFGEIAFTYLRPSGCLFGFRCRGVHLTVYEGQGQDMKIWVAKRSMTKRTWPGKLDSTVGGGLPAGSSPLESMIKECEEEASFPEDFVKRHIKSTGVVTFFMRQMSDGALFPMADFTYEIQLPAPDDPSYLRPQTNDDEVECFELMSVPDVMAALNEDRFSLEAGILMVRFLLCQGIITPENEPDYLELAWRMQRNLETSMRAAAGQAVAQ